MASNPDEGLTQPLSTEQAVWLVGSLAGLHRKQFDADLLLRRFALPWDFSTLIQALAHLGLKTGLVPWPNVAKALPALPAVAFTSSADADPDTPLLVTRRSDGRFSVFRQGHLPRDLDHLGTLKNEIRPWVLLCAEETPAAPVGPDRPR